MQRVIRWVGLTAVVVSVAAAVIVSIQAFARPLLDTSSRFGWAALFALLVAAAVALFLLRRERLLAGLALAAAGLAAVVVLVFSDNGRALLALAWIGLLALGIGLRLMGWLRLPLERNRTQAFALATALGLGTLALVMTLLAGLSLLEGRLPLPGRFFHLFHPYAILIVLPALTVLVAPVVYRFLRDAAARLAFLWRERRGNANVRLAVLAAVLVAVMLIGPLLWALSPAIRYDALTYHLPVPARYLAAQGMVPMAETWNSYWAHYAEMLFALGLALSGQPLPGLLHFSAGLLCGLLAFCLARRLAGTRAGLLAGLLFFAMPMVTFESATVYIDLFVALFAFGGLYAALAWTEDPRPGWLVMSGCFAGLALGTKVSALAAVGLFGLALLVWVVVKAGAARKTLAGWLAFGIPALLLFGVWLLRDWLWTGNPVFPLYNSLFNSPLWQADDIFSLRVEGGVKLLGFLQLPWTLTANPGRYYREGIGGLLGAVPLLAVPWAYAWSGVFTPRLRRLALGLFGYCALVTVLMFKSSANARYLIIIYPLLAVLAALNIELVWRWLAETSRRRLIGALAAVALGVYALCACLTTIVRSWEIPEVFPLPVAAGLESQQAYLSRSLPVYDALQTLDSVGSGAKVLSVGNAYIYYTQAHLYGAILSTEGKRLAESGLSGEALARALADAGYQYVLGDFGTQIVQDADYPVLQPAFLDRYAGLVYARDNVNLYRLLPVDAGAIQSAPGDDLLAGGSFEPADSPAWQAQGVPVIEAAAPASPQGADAARASGTDYFYQDIPAVQAGQLYTLGYWARGAEGDRQVVRPQIVWRDANGATLDIEALQTPLGADWTWVELSSSAPSGAQSARVFVTAEVGSLAWFDGAVFFSGQPGQHP